MKPWITITLASCSVVLAFASWLEATTSTYPPLPAEYHLGHPASQPDALATAVRVTQQAHRSLARIEVRNTTPEQLRARFTDYWSLRLVLDLNDLAPRDQKAILASLAEAHLHRTQTLTADLALLPPSLELQHLAEELKRGVTATSRF